MATSVFMGRGDVVGPSSATDGALAAFDGTTGKLIKVGSASGVYVSSITGTANQIVASAATGAVTLSLSPTLTGIDSLTFSGGQSLVGTTANVTTLVNSTTPQTFRLGFTTTTGVSTVPIADGKWKLSNYAIGAGVVLDFATDSTLKLFARDGTSAAGLQAANGAFAVSPAGGTNVNNLTVANGQAIQFSGRTTLTPAGVGKFGFAAASGTTGVSGDISTDGTIWFRQLDGTTDTATVKANVINSTGSFSANGTAGVTTFGPAAVASITVKQGIITAIS